MFIEATNLFDPQFLIVLNYSVINLVKRELLNKSVRLAIISILLDFDLYVEDCALSKGSAFKEIIFVNLYLRTPRRRHIQCLGKVFEFIFLIIKFSQLY